MSAIDNGRINEIISALQFLSKEKLISYSEEISWLLELKQRLANSEWRNTDYELPTKSGLYLTVGFYRGDKYKRTLFYNKSNNRWYSNNLYETYSVSYWMPLPEDPKNK